MLRIGSGCLLAPVTICLAAACQEARVPTGPEPDVPSASSTPELGATIVFTRLSESQEQNEVEVAEIYVMNADGSGERHVSFNGDFDLFAVDGTGTARLTDSPGRDLDPAWSLDGRSIVFDGDREHLVDQIRQVYLMNPDGTNQRRLTGLPSENAHASWGRGPTTP